MTDLDGVRRQQLLEEAEGYLDLLVVLSDRWPLTPPARDRLGRRALRILDALLPLWDEPDYILYLKGQTLRAMQRYDRAVTALQQAAEADPADLHVCLALGWCFKRMDRVDLAVAALRRALQTHRDEAILHYNLACYCSLAGQPKRALSYLARALQIEPAYRKLVSRESDFDPIRDDPRFVALIEEQV